MLLSTRSRILIFNLLFDAFLVYAIREFVHADAVVPKLDGVGVFCSERINASESAHCNKEPNVSPSL